MKRVVITGLGVVSPVGTGRDSYWSALAEGKNGIGYIDCFDTTDHNVKIAGEIKDFNPELWLDKKEVRRTDRVVQFAEAAASLALEDAKFNADSVDQNRFGVYIGSGQGGISTTSDNIKTLLERGPGRVSPFCVPMMIVNMPAAYVAINHHAKGPNFSVSTACATSLHCIGEAYHAIARGDADYMLAGGAEAAIVPLCTAAFGSLKALTVNSDPNSACCPFDANRSGFVVGEGAGVLMLEEYEAACARGAHIYAELKGYGISCDAYHITAPDPEGDGAYRAMKMAVDHAGWKTEDVELINAHGTSTPMNDRIETAAVKRLMGVASKNVLLQATKSMIGHSLGASGALGTIAALMAVERGIVHPTINYKNADPECDLNCVPNTALQKKIDKLLVNAFGFGGHNAVLAIESCKR